MKQGSYLCNMFRDVMKGKAQIHIQVGSMVIVNFLASVPNISSNIDCNFKYRFPRDLRLFS